MSESATLMLEPIRLLAPIDPARAAWLTELYVHLVEFDSVLSRFDRLVVDLERSGLDGLQIVANPQVIDLNEELRKTVGDILSVPGNIVGAWKLTSAAFTAVRKTADNVAIEVAGEVFGLTVADKLKDLLFKDPILRFFIPPEEIATNSSDLFFGSGFGGEVELRLGDDVFIPHDDYATYEVWGRAGADLLVANIAGTDIMHGGADNDTILAPHGAESLSGNAGADWIQAERSSGVLGVIMALSGGPGSDTVIGSLGDEKLHGSVFSGNAIGSPADADILIGRGGRDTIHGGLGNDTIIGDNFRDIIDAPSGVLANLRAQLEDNVGTAGVGTADLLIGHNGDDLIAGGLGRDTLQGDAVGGAPGILGAPGADTLFGNADNDSLVGGARNDWLDGGTGADVLSGGADADTLIGGVGTDRLVGGQGNDWLNGGNGADTLIGGAGADTMVGGNWADMFVFGARGDLGSGAAADWIMDFSRVQGDKIDLRQIDGSRLLAGDQHVFLASAAPSDTVFQSQWESNYRDNLDMLIRQRQGDHVRLAYFDGITRELVGEIFVFGYEPLWWPDMLGVTTAGPGGR